MHSRAYLSNRGCRGQGVATGGPRGRPVKQPASADRPRTRVWPGPWAGTGPHGMRERGASALAARVARRAGRDVVELVLLRRATGDVGVDLALLGEQLQRPHGHRRAVDVEEAAGRGAGVGEAEAVGAERGVRARDPLADLVLDGPHVVGDAHDRALGALEALGDPRLDRRAVRGE